MKSAWGLLKTLCFTMAVLFSHEAVSKPLITPYAVLSEVALEDGYGYLLKVCGEVLCKLEIKTPQGRIKVSSSELSTVVNPNILASNLYITPENGSYEMINFYIPLADFSPGEKSKETVVFFQFRRLKLHSKELITRNTSRP